MRLGMGELAEQMRFYTVIETHSILLINSVIMSTVPLQKPPFHYLWRGGCVTFVIRLVN